MVHWQILLTPEDSCTGHFLWYQSHERFRILGKGNFHIYITSWYDTTNHFPFLPGATEEPDLWQHAPAPGDVGCCFDNPQFVWWQREVLHALRWREDPSENPTLQEMVVELWCAVAMAWDPPTSPDRTNHSPQTTHKYIGSTVVGCLGPS